MYHDFRPSSTEKVGLAASNCPCDFEGGQLRTTIRGFAASAADCVATTQGKETTAVRGTDRAMVEGWRCEQPVWLVIRHIFPDTEPYNSRGHDLNAKPVQGLGCLFVVLGG